MKMLVLSDLHLEFTDFEPAAVATAAADVVVLAGDIHTGASGIRWARQMFPDKAIVYVAGNHEFYGHDWVELLEILHRQAEVHDVHFLENSSVTIQGIRFFGATLWTDFEFFGESRRSQVIRAAEHIMNDFRLIEADPLPVERNIVTTRSTRNKLTGWHTVRRHRESLAMLKSELLVGDPEKTVVVTHHYPHKNSTAARFANEETTAAFGSNLPNEVLTGAKIWIHGHTHDSCDYRIGDSRRSVRVVCNPRGYPLGWMRNEFENPAFKPGLLVEIDEEKSKGKEAS